jgi:hypothetical protein
MVAEEATIGIHHVDCWLWVCQCQLFIGLGSEDWGVRGGGCAEWAEFGSVLGG